jgi:hypothetical protein
MYGNVVDNRLADLTIGESEVNVGPIREKNS